MLLGVEALADRALTFSSVATGFLLIASLRVFFLVEGAVNALWGTVQTRSLLRRTGLAALVVLVGPVGAGAAMTLVLGSGMPITVFHLDGLLVSVVLFTFLYKAVPSAHVRWGPAIAAGLLAGAGMTLLRKSLTASVVALAGVQQLYGPVSAIVVFVVAAGVSWTLLLFGVSLAHAVQFRDELLAHAEPPRQAPTPGPLEEAVSLLLVLAAAWRRRGAAVTLSELSRETGVPESDARARLRKAVAAGLALLDGESDYRLSRPPETISLYTVARAVGEVAPREVPCGDDETSASLRRLYLRADREERAVLQGISLRDLLEPPGGPRAEGPRPAPPREAPSGVRGPV